MLRSKYHAILASVVVLSSVVALRAAAPGPRNLDLGPRTLDLGPQRSTNDGVYTKAQADSAKAQFDKICASCHAFTVAAKKKPEDLPLGDEPFFKTWEGKALSELVSVITLTMPNDGSAVVDEPEALNLLAYILQQNGAPAGSTPLTMESASALLARPRF